MKDSMKNDIKKMFSPRWWNPLFWAELVVLPPVILLGCIVSGILTGVLVGFERGSAQLNKMLNQILARL